MNVKNQQFIERQIAEGGFSTQEQVVEEALRRWREDEKTHDLGELTEKIRVGIDDLESGRCGPLDITAIKNRVRAELES